MERIVKHKVEEVSSHVVLFKPRFAAHSSLFATSQGRLAYYVSYKDLEPLEGHNAYVAESVVGAQLVAKYWRSVPADAHQDRTPLSYSFYDVLPDEMTVVEFKKGSGFSPNSSQVREFGSGRELEAD